MAESYNICLDVGGTKVLGAIFNEKDEIIYRLKKRSKSGGEGSADVEKVIISVVEEMISESGIDRAKLKAILDDPVLLAEKKQSLKLRIEKAERAADVYRRRIKEMESQNG